MKSLNIVSKTHGQFVTKIDEEDFERIKELGGKWCVVIKRGNPYFQKRFTGNYIKELHRWIMSDPKGKYVDHINGDTLDNRRENLRICSNAANLRNGRLRKNNTSGVKGVEFYKGKWVARIKVNYKTIYLGRFESFQEAVDTRKQAEIKYWST